MLHATELPVLICMRRAVSVASLLAKHSTLIRLYVRRYDPDVSATTNEIGMRNLYTQESLRTLFHAVSRDTSLFNRTLR